MLIPGLFGNAEVGEGWPDGNGHFHLDGNTPYSTDDLLDLANSFSVYSIVLKQARHVQMQIYMWM